MSPQTREEKKGEGKERETGESVLPAPRLQIEAARRDARRGEWPGKARPEGTGKPPLDRRRAHHPPHRRPPPQEMRGDENRPPPRALEEHRRRHADERHGADPALEVDRRALG